MSHIRTVHFTLISRINKQFIHLKANCMNSTPCSSKCAASGASSFSHEPRVPNGKALTVYALDQFRHPLDEALDTRLMRDVIVLYSIKQLRETPERVGFDGSENSRIKVADIE